MVTATIRMPLTHRRLPVLALALVVMAFAVTSPLLVTAYDFGDTVMGADDEPGFADGMHGVSRITSPNTMCIYTPSTADRVGGSDDVIMVAADGYFRMYDRTIGVTTTLRTASGDLFRHTDGVITGCVQHVTPTQASIVYYVSGDSKVNWIQEGNVHSITVTPPNTTKFIAVDVQDDRLFLMTTDMDAVWSCALSSTGPANCRMHTFPASLTWEITGTPVIAVNSEAIFVATGKSVYAFAVPSKNDTAVPKLTVNGEEVDYYMYKPYNILAVRKAADGSIYGLSKFFLLAFYPGFVDPYAFIIFRKDRDLVDMHVFHHEELYLAQMGHHSVVGLGIDRSRVVVPLPRPPVPLGMDDGIDTLYTVAREVQRAAAKAVPNAVGVFVNTADIAVNAHSWRSTVPVQIYKSGSNSEVTTQKLVQSPDYSAAIRAVATYYDKTNEVVAADALLLPMCDGQLMRSAETAIASHASELLQYPVIYTTPIDAAAATVGGTTPVKLLMPAHFNNKTTESTLAAGEFNMAILEELRRSVPADHRYTVELTQEEVNLGAFDERRRQKARADIQRIALQRLEQCGYHAAAISSCNAPAVGVSPILSDNDGASHFELFLSPEAYSDAGTGTTFAKCLDGANWEEISATAAEWMRTGWVISMSVAIVLVVVHRRRMHARRAATKKGSSATVCGEV